MVIYGIIYKAIFLSYLYLFETRMHFPISCFRNSSFFEITRPFFFFFLFILWTKISTSSFKSSFKLILRCKFFTSSFKFFSSILWSQNVTSSLSEQRHYHYHYHYYHLKAKKRIGYLGTQSPNFSS